ncbi:hypothetical protein DN752_19835 [Echinicola strongylocentroti]|uniref:PpiC domain-containing protein n=1 Tax=Echinicola strongylocentroti TaxID=1795355 RepID=A0A2Z4IN85_9BACT|nr:peptidylprolyl isomerase [Echinicola strongylocentroti]AWW32207.1 hypothetical protein DN752_19835 [Echinicola strongylocentroti]
MKKWIKEPLIHFMALGAIIFLLFSLVNTSDGDERQIVIDDDRLEHINALWEIQWKRPATPTEMQGLIENYIRQEVLYREALRMNLDHNDEVVKRRLSQKMEFMAGDLNKIVEPVTETKLKAYFEAHKEDYRIPPTYSFEHVLISAQDHDNPKNYATALMATVDASQMASLQGKGDHTMLPLRFENAGMATILKNLGSVFYDGLDPLPRNQWAGPVKSGFGHHLVFITNKTNARIPELAEVKDKVIRDYEYTTEMATKDAVYQEMKDNYEVVVSSEELNADQIASLLANLHTP